MTSPGETDKPTNAEAATESSKRFARTDAIALFLVVAILLLAGGAVILQSRALIERPTDGYQYPDRIRACDRAVRSIGFAGALLIDLGAFLFAAVGLLTALRRPDLSDGLRRGLVVMSVALLIAWLLLLVAGASYIEGKGICTGY